MECIVGDKRSPEFKDFYDCKCVGLKVVNLGKIPLEFTEVFPSLAEVKRKEAQMLSRIRPCSCGEPGIPRMELVLLDAQEMKERFLNPDHKPYKTRKHVISCDSCHSKNLPGERVYENRPS